MTVANISVDISLCSASQKRVKDTHRQKSPSDKIPELTKSTNKDN